MSKAASCDERGAPGAARTFLSAWVTSWAGTALLWWAGRTAAAPEYQGLTLEGKGGGRWVKGGD
eukprot:scaffold47189_cov73-Phaeocystis_antarctica.AAC.6